MTITGVSTVSSDTRLGVSAGVMAAFRIVLLFFPMTLVHLCLHEGGHALVALLNQVPHVEIFVHPFSFAGYSRPIFDYSNTWFHLGGTLSSLGVSLILFISLWRHRNQNRLLPLMLFPWFALWEGLAFLLVLGKNGDYYNLSQVSGLPAGLFVGIGAVLFLVGSALFMSLFPRLGLAPEDKNTLWAVPAGIGVYGLVSLGVATWLAPASPFLLEQGLVQEVLDTARLQPLAMTVAGLFSAGLYVSLYRAIQRKLPAWLRTEARPLAFQDLRWPAGWAAASIGIGLLLIL